MDPHSNSFCTLPSCPYPQQISSEVPNMLVTTAMEALVVQIPTKSSHNMLAAFSKLWQLMRLQGLSLSTCALKVTKTRQIWMWMEERQSVIRLRKSPSKVNRQDKEIEEEVGPRRLLLGLAQIWTAGLATSKMQNNKSKRTSSFKILTALFSQLATTHTPIMTPAGEVLCVAVDKWSSQANRSSRCRMSIKTVLTWPLRTWTWTRIRSTKFIIQWCRPPKVSTRKSN